MDYKAFRFEDCKAVGDALKGEFSGYAAVYGNEDRNGEIIDVGAMKRSINSADGEFPLLWQHQRDIPIGVVRLEETDRGAKAYGKMNLDNQMARQAFSLMIPPEGFKRAALRDLSIGYNVNKEDMRDGVRHLKEIHLFEVSVVTIAANPKSNITQVKELQATEDRIGRIELALKAISATLVNRDLVDNPDEFHLLLKDLQTGPGFDPSDPDVVHSLEELLTDQTLYQLRRTCHGERDRGP